MDKTPLKILVITVPAWNSRVGSNTWASLLESYDSTNIANICIRDELPDSPVCSRYFVISENKVLKSIFKPKLITGREVSVVEPLAGSAEDLEEHNERYRKMTKKRRYSMLMARELVWKLGRWKSRELDAFLDDFRPDIILHSMEGYIHLNRIIQYAVKRTGAKAVGYIWDDNFTYKQSNKLGYKVYRFFQRGSLKRLAKHTNAFWAISELTKAEADAFFGIDCHVLTKPLNRIPEVAYGDIVKPIRMLYTGNLQIGRDRSLLKVVQAIKQLPAGSFIIDVYTKTVLSAQMQQELACDFCHIHAPIPQTEVLEKQKQADVLLFLEDIDGPDAKVARLSFSTKTTDYLSSGRCIFAVGCRDTAPIQYFINHEAALVACSEQEVAERLQAVLDSPDCLAAYAERAKSVGMIHHDPAHVQRVFDSVIRSV